MKSYFSRFLHHIMSHSDVNPQSTDILSYSGLTRISRWGKFANLVDLDTPIKSECDNIESVGRSMVEMLGVLAIIGVLSVGAIAGYSKAMMKYKLNQHAQAVNMLINNVLSIKDRLEHTPNTATFYGTLLYKLNLLPDGIKYNGNANLTDMWFKGTIQIYYSNDIYTNQNGQQIQNNLGAISFIFDSNSDTGTEICRNIAFAAKENAANVWLLQRYDLVNNYYGDKYCNNRTNCLRDLNLKSVDEICNNCTDENCNLRVLWR